MLFRIVDKRITSNISGVSVYTFMCVCVFGWVIYVHCVCLHLRVLCMHAHIDRMGTQSYNVWTRATTTATTMTTKNVQPSQVMGAYTLARSLACLLVSTPLADTAQWFYALLWSSYCKRSVAFCGCYNIFYWAIFMPDCDCDIQFNSFTSLCGTKGREREQQSNINDNRTHKCIGWNGAAIWIG